MNLRIAILGLLTAGAVVGLIVVATGGDEVEPRAGRVLRPEARPGASKGEAASAQPEPREDEPEKVERPQPAVAPGVAKPAANPVGGAQNNVGESPQPAARRVPALGTGASPKAMLELKDAYEAWMKTEENKFAKPESYGLDCSPPVCMLGAKYDSLEDGRFFDRSEAFFKARTDLGHLISFPHRMDERHSRTWFYYNPYEPGTAEHHEFNLAAIERIKEEKKDIPEYYPVPRPGYD